MKSVIFGIAADSEQIPLQGPVQAGVHYAQQIIILRTIKDEDGNEPTLALGRAEVVKGDKAGRRAIGSVGVVWGSDKEVAKTLDEWSRSTVLAVVKGASPLTTKKIKALKAKGRDVRLCPSLERSPVRIVKTAGGFALQHYLGGRQWTDVVSEKETVKKPVVKKPVTKKTTTKKVE